jgi:hypothetical protein
MTLDQVFKMDAYAIDTLLLATLQDRAKYRQLVKRHGQEAQSLLDLLQAVRIFIAVVCSFHHHDLTLYSVWVFRCMHLSNICT